MRIFVLALTLCTTPLSVAPARADVQIRFIEGAPVDAFEFTNIGSCDLGPMTLVLDLSPSPAGLIFDATEAGAGVEVFQPLRVREGENRLVSVPKVRDGDTVLSLGFNSLPSGGRVVVTADLDDTLTAGALGQIRVADSEIAGAVMRMTTPLTQAAAFDGTARAVLPIDTCTS